MLRRLILHLGMGKTGSTTIQTFLKKNEERLRREGFLAFGPGEIQPDPHRNLLDTTRFLEAVDEVVRRITEADAHSLIWSLEGFGTRQFVSDPARIETILSKLRATEVRLVVYLRRQDTFAPSAYLQWNVTHKAYDGPVRSFDELFPSIYNEGPGKPLEATNLNYYEVVRPWVDAFGLSQMRIRSLERAQILKGDLVADFEDAAGLPDINYDRDVPPKNVTFNMELTDMQGMYVSTFEGPVLPGSMDWFFNGFGSDDYFSEPFFTKFELPPAKRREILEACEPFNARVAREYLGRDDGVLFAEPWPAADAPYKTYDGLTLEKLVPILLYIMRKQQSEIVGLYRRFDTMAAAVPRVAAAVPRVAAAVPRVAVLIASQNDENFLATTLLSIFHEAAVYQAAGGVVTICVVDDGSTDATSAVLNGMRHLSPANVTVISRRRPRGPAHSLNEAFVACAGAADLVLRADADARFIQSGWLRQMVSFLTSDERIGIVAPLSVFPDGVIDSHGVNYLPNGRTIVLHDQDYATEPIAPIAEVDAVLGVYCLMRAFDWEIDSSYSAWRDDEDQCLALRRRGRKCFSMGSLEVVHYHRMRWARVSDRIRIPAWQRRQMPPPPRVQPSRWSEIRYGTELLAAGLLPGFAKKAIRKFVPPAPLPTLPQSQPDSDNLEATWRRDSEHFAHKWGFPSVDPWTHVPLDQLQWPLENVDALAQSRAAILLGGRYTREGMVEAQAIVERHLRTQEHVVGR